MIPNNDNYNSELTEDLIPDFELETLPSLSHRLNVEKYNVVGKVDELEAVKQAVYKILNTERYEKVIYSWNYGIELQDLIGQDLNYVSSEIGDRIRESLIQDDRIEDVTDIEIETLDKKRLHVTFTVMCVFGEFSMEKEVTI